MMRPVPVRVLIAFCALLPSKTIVCAQTPLGPPRPTDFNYIFPHPTGLNGYEELVMAGELIRGNAALNTAQEPGATLAAKRRALDDADIQQALALLRIGLDKKITSSRPTFDNNTRFPEYASFRALARLLAVEQYVQLADGQTEGAIQNTRDGLRLGMAARADHVFISELVGVAIDAISVSQIGRHLDQLSEPDCDSLSRLLEERAAAQPTAHESLIRERDNELREIERVRKDPRSVIKEWLSGQDAEDSPDADQMVASLTASSAVVDQAVDAAAEMIKQQFDTMLAELQLPPWQRTEVSPPAGKTLADELRKILSPSYGALLDRFTMNNVQINLLAIHVAIRKYRWQYDHPPNTLEQLRLDNGLTVDPFSGKPLGYRRQGDEYDLFSEGPNERGDDGERIPGQRKPIFTRR